MASEPAVPVITNINGGGAQKNLRFAPYPAAQAYTILSASNLAQAFAANPNFVFSPYVISTNVSGTNYGYEWRATNATAPFNFYRVQVTPLSSNALLTANVLNRLAYGPTPDELERVGNITPQSFIAEQLAPWSITEDVASAHPNIGIIEAKFCAVTNLVTATNANMADLRAWHILRAVNARRQLLEILLQFWENHFVTQYTKSEGYVDNFYPDSTISTPVAVQFEYRENDRWRNALLNPACTFYDLLKISAESPAMIIYLDTVTSRGDGTRVANENYARELLELFTFGVDNGYDQNDITVMSRAWSGWTIKFVDFTNVSNPFAAQTTTIIPGSTNASSTDTVVIYFNGKSKFTDELINLISFWKHATESAKSTHTTVSFDYIDVRYGANVVFKNSQ